MRSPVPYIDQQDWFNGSMVYPVPYGPMDWFNGVRDYASRTARTLQAKG